MVVFPLALTPAISTRGALVGSSTLLNDRKAFRSMCSIRTMFRSFDGPAIGHLPTVPTFQRHPLRGVLADPAMPPPEAAPPLMRARHPVGEARGRRFHALPCGQVAKCDALASSTPINRCVSASSSVVRYTGSRPSNGWRLPEVNSNHVSGALQLRHCPWPFVSS